MLGGEGDEGEREKQRNTETESEWGGRGRLEQGAGSCQATQAMFLFPGSEMGSNPSSPSANTPTDPLWDAKSASWSSQPFPFQQAQSLSPIKTNTSVLKGSLIIITTAAGI